MKEDMDIHNKLITHAHSIFIDQIFKDKLSFALFYLNWIGVNHVITVLTDSLKHGDLHQEIIENCSTTEEVETFINNKISSNGIGFVLKRDS